MKTRRAHQTVSAAGPAAGQMAIDCDAPWAASECECPHPDRRVSCQHCRRCDTCLTCRQCAGHGCRCACEAA